MTEEKQLGFAYWAGVIDSDGCIQIRKSTAKKRKTPTHTLNVSLGQKNKLLVDEIKKFFEVGHIILRSKRERSAAQWIFYVLSNDAVYCLEKLLPYLKLKKERAKLGIAFQKNRKSYIGRRGTPQDEIEKREQYWLRMRIMNSPQDRHKLEPRLVGDWD